MRVWPGRVVTRPALGWVRDGGEVAGHGGAALARPHFHDRGEFSGIIPENSPQSWGISPYEQDQTHMVRNHRRGLSLAALTAAAIYELAATQWPDGPGSGRAYQNPRQRPIT